MIHVIVNALSLLQFINLMKFFFILQVILQQFQHQDTGEVYEIGTPVRFVIKPAA
jgi:hypothetical protein